MSKSPRKPAYQERNIDAEVIAAACKWNVEPKPGYEKASVICLKSDRSRGNTSLLLHLEDQLKARGFQPIYIDPAAKRTSHAPNSLALALHQMVATRRVYRLKVELRRRLYSSRLRQFTSAIVILAFLAWYLWYKYSQDHSYLPPYLHNFLHVFLANNLFQIFTGLFGYTAILSVLLFVISASIPVSSSFDEKAEAEFGVSEGYFRALSHLWNGKPIALLVDNAKSIDLSAEIGIVNKLLAANNELPPGLPNSFRIVAITVGLPPRLRLCGRDPLFFTVPKLSATLQKEVDDFTEQIKGEIDASLVAAADKRKDGVVGLHEWLIYEAALGRQSIAPKELQSLYQNVIASDILPLIGLSGPHRQKPPATILRTKRTATDELIFKPLYCDQTVEFYADHHKNLLAKARLMLAIPGINRNRSGVHWRDWDSAIQREVVYAAEHAEDLADSDQNGRDVFSLLQADDEAKHKTILELFELLVVAAEIQKARGHLLRATDFLQSAAKWYATVEATIPEPLQSRFFYGLWTNFWLSCDVDERTWIRNFESTHPDIRKSNTWKILNNWESRLAGLPLDHEVTDPGEAFPELANIHQFAMLKDGVIRLHGDDYDAAANRTSLTWAASIANESPLGSASGFRRLEMTSL